MEEKSLEARLRRLEIDVARFKAMERAGGIIWRVILYTGGAVVGTTEVYDRIISHWGWWR